MISLKMAPLIGQELVEMTFEGPFQNPFYDSMTDKLENLNK